MYSPVRLFAFIIPFLCIAYSVHGQVKPDSLIELYLDKAKEQIALKNYPSANDHIKKIFSLRTTLPDEVAFYYGLTQVKLTNYTKGKEALLKYIELTGVQGSFYAEAEKLIAEADEFICEKCNNTGSAEVLDTCVVCNGVGKTEVACEVCRSKGVEFCNACGGKGVFVENGSFGSTFSTCKKCSGEGYIQCTLCRGTKVKSVTCKECKGKGGIKRKIKCNH